MQIQTIVGKIQEQETPALVLNLFEGVTEPAGATGAVDVALGGAIRALIAAGDFRGKRNEVAVLYPVGEFPARRVLLVGLGKAEKFTVESIRQAAATVARKARDLGATQLHTLVHGAGIGGIETEIAAQAVVEGTILGLYRYQELKTQLDDVRPDPETLVLVELDPAKLDAIKAGARAGQIIAEATCLARNLVNRPANVATPSRIAETAQVMADVVGLQCRIMEKPEMESLGMGALLSVNKGGGEPAKMVILEHNADREDLPTVVLVGKGITFADMRGTLNDFARRTFGENARTRLRPSFFPFTEPSAEMDISCVSCRGEGCRICKNSGWLELGGAGMVDPAVFRILGIDPEIWSGYALGVGIERIAMLTYNIPDMRILFENDIRMLRQFSGEVL